jgi:putative extracellular protein
MTIQRRNRTRRLQLEPLEDRDVPSVVSPHAGLLRPMARAEVHRAAHHHVQAARVHAPAAVAASSTTSAGAASSSIPPAESSPAPITVVLGPMVPWAPGDVTEAQVWISPPMTAPAPVPDGSISST